MTNERTSLFIARVRRRRIRTPHHKKTNTAHCDMRRNLQLMDIDLKDHSLEIHIAIADAKIQGIVFGQGYNPDVYNDLVTQTLAAFRQALTIAVEHGYTFPTDDEDEDDDGDGD